MKTFMFILVSCLAMGTYGEKNLPANGNTHGGRCTGSASCSACSNCSRCAHCGAGGTCGVCAGTSSGRSYAGKYNTQGNSSSGSGTSRNKSVYAYVNTETLNLRAGKGTAYGITEKLVKNQKLVVLNTSGEWLHVRVANTASEGYVHKAYVRWNY